MSGLLVLLSLVRQFVDISLLWMVFLGTVLGYRFLDGLLVCSESDSAAARFLLNSSCFPVNRVAIGEQSKVAFLRTPFSAWRISVPARTGSGDRRCFFLRKQADHVAWAVPFAERSA